MSSPKVTNFLTSSSQPVVVVSSPQGSPCNGNGSNGNGSTDPSAAAGNAEKMSCLTIASAAASTSTASPASSTGASSARCSPVATSQNGNFILQYLGAAMMDSRCTYTPQMMPWIIAEILRFSEPIQVVLIVSNGQVTCNSMSTRKPIFDSHILDCIRTFPVITTDTSADPSLSNSGNNPPLNNEPVGDYDIFDERKYFATIIKANDIYLHCRLFSASSDAQVTEVMSTMKESTRIAVNGSVGPGGVSGGLRSSPAPKISDLSDIPTDAITFEVLYTGKLRMSSRKAPPTFIDDALAKFKSHEDEKGRRCSVAMSYSSRRSSSQESTSDLGGSSDSLQSAIALCKQVNQNEEALGTAMSTAPGASESINTAVRSPLIKNPLIPFIEAANCPIPEVLDDDAEAETEEKDVVDKAIKETQKSVIEPELNIQRKKEREISPLKSCLRHPLEDIESARRGQRARTPSGDFYLIKSMSLPMVEPMRNRALSTGHSPRHNNNDLETNKSDSQYNRTMILIIGKHELKIISPDAKSTLFSKHFKDIYHSSQGIENKEYFGFICRESPASTSSSPSSTSSMSSPPSSKPSGVGYVGYIFKCDSDSVAGEILKVLKQAYIVNHENLKKERQIQACDHCPMVWYRQLCNDIDGIPCDERIQSCIIKNINGLPDEDRQNILAKFHGAEPQTTQEQNELLMMLLRAHCESKQAKHIHDTAENRHEFLSQYLGGGAILMKAKRSITNSFDHLIKRKGREGFVPTRENSLPHYSTFNKEVHGGNPSLSGRGGGAFASGLDNSGNSPGVRRKSPGDSEKDEDDWFSMVVSDSPLENIPRRPRSSTIGALSGEKIRCEIRNRRTSQGLPLSPSPLTERRDSRTLNFRGNGGSESGGLLSPRNMGSKEQKQHSPMMNIFLKVGSQNKPPSAENSAKSVRRSGSWRHAIFKRVVSPSTPDSAMRGSTPISHCPSTPVSSRTGYLRTKRTKEEIRDLWKSAINQQIILIRMEKQNIRLKAKQQEADVKRLKLSYLELGTCDEEANDTWDLIMNQAQANPNQKCDIQLLNSAILRGIPKHKRGQVWQFFIQQRNLSGENQGNASSYSHINLDIPYEQLLRQLTSQQHAILIDLGRTFPQHAYLNSPLGSGQLALFNILKAYSLLDTDVGYCQGLSFVAGLLLMHYEENDAFTALKYLMFSLGAREHYKPDMLGLQVKLYQLTRLIHDQDPDIQLLLYHNDVLPSLYAAPWFLTMFASQFPVGFAVRVLDVVMLHGVDVIAKFAVAIVLDHKKELMECNGLEQVMDCFKTVVTQVTTEKLDRYLRKVMESDWDKQMLTYAVEYSVMNDEAFSAFLNESSATNLPVKLNKQVSLENKFVQTDDSRETSPTGTGESHPILGELIKRQNSEISKLKQEKSELRKDIQTLLSCVLTMQKLAKISSKGAICPPVPPQVTDIASKYVIGGINYFSSVMENGWPGDDTVDNSSNNGSSTTTSFQPHQMRDSSLKAVQDFGDHEQRVATTIDEDKRSSSFSSRNIRGQRLFESEYTRSSQLHQHHQGIPSLDQDSDDNSSDHSSHQISISFDAITSTSAANKTSSSTAVITTSQSGGVGTDMNGGKQGSHNNNGLNENTISTISM